MDYKQKYLKYKNKYIALKQDIYTQGDSFKNKYLELKDTYLEGAGIGRSRSAKVAPLPAVIYKCPFKVGDNVYVKEILRVFNIGGQLRGLSEEEIRTKPVHIGEVVPIINIPANDQVSVIEVLYKKEARTPQKDCYRIKVRHGDPPGTVMVINSTNLRSQNNFDLNAFEINCEIWKLKTWQELVELSISNPSIAGDIRKCQFDFYDQRPMTFAIFQRYFPCAIGLNLSNDLTLVDANFAAFASGRISPDVKRGRGIHRLNMSYCNQVGITNAAFVNLKGIHTLYMSHCSQVGITNAAFVNLRGIHTLNMSWCWQITNAAFVNLRGIHALDMRGCDQAGITNAAFVNLRGIHTLSMSHCNQVGITDAAFVNLRGINTLKMIHCNQVGITDAAFVNLKGIHNLDMSDCNQVGITDAAFVNLRGIHELSMSGCDQVGITDAAFVNLRGIHTLEMADCNQVGITGAAFVNLIGIYRLEMWRCRPNIIAAARALGLNVIA